jgi:hypothetical protein
MLDMYGKQLITEPYNPRCEGGGNTGVCSFGPGEVFRTTIIGMAVEADPDFADGLYRDEGGVTRGPPGLRRVLAR